MGTMKTRRDQEARSIAEQAAEWLLILEDRRDEDRRAFAEWLAQSPLHVGAFLRASAVNTLGAEIDPERRIPVERGPFAEATPITARDADPKEARQPRRFGVKAWAFAACVTLALIGAAAFFGTGQFSANDWKHYSADVGEQRVLVLPDGSTMYLEPGSAVDVRFLRDERRLRLQSGGAMFRVAHDRARPFRVHAGNVVAQAVGTQFSVSRVRNHSVVSVVEGEVQVSRDWSLVEKLMPIAAPEVTSVRLTAGEETRVAADGQMSRPKKAQADPVKSWKERRLTFVNETLYAIAEEFNRYNREPKIRVVDAAAGELRFAAAFDADDPQSLVQVLEGNPKLKVERKNSEILILSR